MSLLFCSYVLFAPGEPATSYFTHRQLGALIPYIPRTLACCKASGFRLPSDATCAVLELFLWCYPSTQNGHTHHLVATKVGAVVFATSERKRRGMWVGNGAERSRLPLVRPSRPVLRAPPGTRPRRTTRGRVSRPGETGRSSRRQTTVAVTVRAARLCLRRHAATIGAIATALVSDTATTAGTTPTIAGVTPSTGSLSRCVPHCLLVVLQHLGHCCLHGSACLLALQAQLAAQSQGGRPG